MTSDSVLPFSACSETEERTTAYHSRQHESWFPYLMDALQEIPPISNGKEKFVEECRKIYHNNQPALNFLDEFDRTYRSNMAISWYTREGILYQLFNRTLRQLDQNRVILFHFFIYDMSQQLKTEHETNRNAPWRNESLYRGQRMSKKELEFLQTAAIIYVNTFLSTTRDLSLAKIYAGVGSYPSNSESTEQSVVFNIPPLESCTVCSLAGSSGRSKSAPRIQKLYSLVSCGRYCINTESPFSSCSSLIINEKKGGCDLVRK